MRFLCFRFNHRNPEDSEAVPGGFLSDVNRDSLHVYTSLCDKSLAGSPHYTTYQFERIGYFTVDTDSTLEKVGNTMSRRKPPPIQSDFMSMSHV